jgi:hypothetical protein
MWFLIPYYDAPRRSSPDNDFCILYLSFSRNVSNIIHAVTLCYSTTKWTKKLLERSCILHCKKVKKTRFSLSIIMKKNGKEQNKWTSIVFHKKTWTFWETNIESKTFITSKIKLISLPIAYIKSKHYKSSASWHIVSTCSIHTHTHTHTHTQTHTQVESPLSYHRMLLCKNIMSTGVNP